MGIYIIATDRPAENKLAMYQTKVGHIQSTRSIVLSALDSAGLDSNEHARLVQANNVILAACLAVGDAEDFDVFPFDSSLADSIND